jgi:hypothetical protein
VLLEEDFAVGSVLEEILRAASVIGEREPLVLEHSEQDEGEASRWYRVDARLEPREWLSRPGCVVRLDGVDGDDARVTIYTVAGEPIVGNISVHPRCLVPSVAPPVHPDRMIAARRARRSRQGKRR